MVLMGRDSFLSADSPEGEGAGEGEVPSRLSHDLDTDIGTAVTALWTLSYGHYM